MQCRGGIKDGASKKYATYMVDDGGWVMFGIKLFMYFLTKKRGHQIFGMLFDKKWWVLNFWQKFIKKCWCTKLKVQQNVLHGKNVMKPEQEWEVKQ